MDDDDIVPPAKRGLSNIRPADIGFEPPTVIELRLRELMLSEGVNVSISWFEGKGFEHYESILEYAYSGEFQAFLYHVAQEAEHRSLRVSNLLLVGGLWEGRFEPSASLSVKGDETQILRFAVVLGKRYNQDSVILFKEDQDGDGILYWLYGIEDVNAVGAAMREAEIHGRFVETSQGTYLEIALPVSYLTEYDVERKARLMATYGYEGYVKYIEMNAKVLQLAQTFSLGWAFVNGHFREEKLKGNRDDQAD